MGNKRKHSNKRASDFFDYSTGKTRGSDRNAFERRLQKDPFEAEAAEGLEMVSREEMEEDLREVSGKILRRTRRKQRIVWYSAAAAVASLMIVATIFFNIDDGSMDRYKTAPEFEEAGQEQSPGTSIEKKERRKDVIPDVEPGPVDDRLPAAGRQEDRMQETEAFDREVQEKVDPEVQEEVDPEVQEKVDPEVQEEVDPAVQQMKREKLSTEAMAVKEALAREAAQDVTAREENAREIAAREKSLAMEVAPTGSDRNKRTAGEVQAVRADQQVIQDEIPDVEIVQPLQERLGEAPQVEAVQPVFVNHTEENAEVAAKAAEEETRESLPAEDDRDEITQPLHGKVAGVNVSQNPQGQVAGVDVTQNPQGQVSGIVYSADDLSPIPGVSLFIKGSTTGTVSDIDGKFTLNTTDAAGNTLVARTIGMQTEEIPLTTGQTMEIAMVPDAVQLDEVVVVGQTSTAHRSLTSSVTKVEPDPTAASEYITASPVDGIVAYKQYIDSTLVYPPVTGSPEKEVVVLKFSVTPNGRPYDFEVIRSPGAPFTQEAIRIINAGPDWNPTTRDGMYVDDQVRLRIVFRPASQ